MIVKNVEDCLETLFNFNDTNFKFSIDKSDFNLLNSLARQVFRGVALTDRQHSLTKQKLLEYKNQFESFEIDINDAISNLRMPLRHIDRTRYIKLVHDEKDNLVIAVRFVFQKKLITKIDSLRADSDTIAVNFDKENKIHYFKFSENSLYKICTLLENSNFEMDDNVKNIFNRCKDWADNEHIHAPGIKNYSLQNLPQIAIDRIVKKLGDPSAENILKYYDKRNQLGLVYFDSSVKDKINELDSLSIDLLNRKTEKVFIKNYSLEDIFKSLNLVDRFPLLVVLPDNDQSYNYIEKIHQIISQFIDNSQQTVLFRQDSHVGTKFNSYIKNNNLNNTLDKNIKIVYISNNKVPKPLLKTDINFETSFILGGSRTHTKVDVFMERLDLSIYYDEENNMPSQWYYRKNEIEIL